MDKIQVESEKYFSTFHRTGIAGAICNRFAMAKSTGGSGRDRDMRNTIQVSATLQHLLYNARLQIDFSDMLICASKCEQIFGDAKRLASQYYLFPLLVRLIFIV